MTNFVSNFYYGYTANPHFHGKVYLREKTAISPYLQPANLVGYKGIFRDAERNFISESRLSLGKSPKVNQESSSDSYDFTT